MRTANPTYLTQVKETGQWRFEVRIRRPDGSMRRVAQNVPLHLVTKAEREQWARQMAKALRAEEHRAVTEDFLASIQQRRTGCTMGMILDRLESPEEQVRKSAKDEAKLPNQLCRVIAMAKGLWVPAKGIKGVKEGAMVPDRSRIRDLSATVLDAPLVLAYFRAALGLAAGEKLNWREVYDGAAGINSRLNQARDCFRGASLQVKLAGLKLPDLSGFMKGRLRQGEMKPEPVLAETFDAMVAFFDGLKATRPELWLVNLVIRQTGCRSLSTAMQMHRSWMRKLADGWWLDVEGKTSYAVPITDELAEEMLKSEGYTFLPDGTPTEREELLREHTALLKGIIGESSDSKVNHRLRKTVASATYHWLGIAVAQEALGHADEKTTRKHYARRIDVSEVMKRELRAWERVLR